MSVLGRLRRAHRSLGVRLSALLTVALLPLGLIAVVQTAQVNAVARDREDLVFLALTEQAASRERRAIERAIGVVQGLSVLVPALAENEATCDAEMREVAGGQFPYTFAGYIAASGIMTCSSVAESLDFSDRDDFRAFLEAPRTTVVASPRGVASREPVIIISEPVRDGADLAGLVAVSIRQEVQPSGMLADGTVDVLTFNDAGEVLKSSTVATGEDATPDLPRGVSLADLVSRPADVFEGRDGRGRERVFAVVPIVPGVVYTLGSWDRAASLGPAGWGALPVWLFPLLMWAMSLAVAYFAVHRLVIRHVRLLVLRMRDFARDRSVAAAPGIDAPAELQEIEAGLTELTEQVLRDEAEAENRIHEQKVLMKEIHHRVKNNLQLISSIINMQMRQLDEPEARLVLGRVRDRVLGLATIHRNLYEASDVTGVAADAAIRDIVAQLTRTAGADQAGNVSLVLDPVLLYPDQAVPLSLFVTEAVTNALKHGAGGTGAVSVRLTTEGGSALLVVENALSHGAAVQEDRRGLGNRLIKAFATQLDGRVEIERTDRRYAVTLEFPVEAFADPAASGEGGAEDVTGRAA